MVPGPHVGAWIHSLRVIADWPWAVGVGGCCPASWAEDWHSQTPLSLCPSDPPSCFQPTAGSQDPGCTGAGLLGDPAGVTVREASPGSVAPPSPIPRGQSCDLGGGHSLFVWGPEDGWAGSGASPGNGGAGRDRRPLSPM